MADEDDRLPRFDDEVVRAMAKWPNVPQCFGWLKLDRRGAWRIRGEPIRHARAVAFLSRHYRADDRGRWYVQNGPQQVFVDLEYTPWIYRYHPRDGFATHTGVPVDTIEAAYVDDEGNLLLVAGIGAGVVDDRDLEACSGLLEFDGEERPIALRWRDQRLPVRTVARSDAAAEFGFDPAPRG